MVPTAYTVDDIYQLMNFICNKKQSGAIGPDRFNTALRAVNLDMFKVYAGLPEEFSNENGVPRMVWQANTKITDVLYPFHKVKFIGRDVDNHFKLPDDYAAFSGIMTVQVTDIGCCNDTEIKKSWRKIKFVTEGERVDRMSSNLKPPTDKYPIGAYYDLGILVDPEDIKYIRFAYLRYPQTPYRGYNIVNDVDVYDTASSVQLEWPAIVHVDFTVRICRYVGINIREAELVKLATERQLRGQ